MDLTIEELSRLLTDPHVHLLPSLLLTRNVQNPCRLRPWDGFSLLIKEQCLRPMPLQGCNAQHRLLRGCQVGSVSVYEAVHLFITFALLLSNPFHLLVEALFPSQETLPFNV
jgi:hypothetical protein